MRRLLPINRRTSTIFSQVACCQPPTTGLLSWADLLLLLSSSCCDCHPPVVGWPRVRRPSAHCLLSHHRSITNSYDPRPFPSARLVSSTAVDPQPPAPVLSTNPAITYIPLFTLRIIQLLSKRPSSPSGRNPWFAGGLSQRRELLQIIANSFFSGGDLIIAKSAELQLSPALQTVLQLSPALETVLQLSPALL